MPSTSAPRIARPLRNARTRSGAITVALAIGSTTLLGMIALASEAGVWLTVRRNAQAAADAGAMAGILALAQVGGSEVDSRARQVVTRNGFTNAANGTVTVELGFWNNTAFSPTVPSGSSANAVRVQVSQQQNMWLGRLISTAAPVAWGGAVAVRAPGGPACILSIPPPGGGTSQVDGSVYISGNNALDAPQCLIASNKPGRRSIELGNNAAGSLIAAALRAHGQCYNCNDVPTSQLPGGFASYQPETENPFADLDNRTLNPMPTFGNGANQSTCTAPTYRDSAGNIITGGGGNSGGGGGNSGGGGGGGGGGGNNSAPSNWVSMTLPGVNTPGAAASNSAVGVCNQTISVGAGQTLTLQAGNTYYFSNASLVQTGGTIACSNCTSGGGVTLVFTGPNANSVGYIRLTGGTFNLVAPGDTRGVPAIYDGVAVYRDILGGTSNAANDNIRIEGNSSSTFFGGLYAPTSEVQMVGTSTLVPPMGQTGNCMSIVGGRISLSGNSSVAVSTCAAYGVPTAQTVVLRLVQ